MSVEERILRAHCSASLADEYDRMTPSDRSTFREALVTSVRMKVFSIEQRQAGQTTIPSHEPLANLLKELLPSISQPSVEMVTNLEDHLSRWGAISSSLAQYQQTVANQRYQYSTVNPNMAHSLTTSTVVSKQKPHTVPWNDSLRKISVSDLVLFQTAKGCYIEGKIVGDPIQPMVGGTTLIQESCTRKVLLVCFYNVLPDGIRGTAAEPLLKREFPMGSTLRIVEPFYKIFGDGQRGIRVDTPSELHVVDINNRNALDRDAVSAQTSKDLGNGFVKKKQYMAAMDSYLGGLHSSSESEFVATLLSNRCQAHAQLGDWMDSLSDAAASLTIRPNSKKTWARYRKALAELFPTQAAPSKSSQMALFLEFQSLLTQENSSESSICEKIVDMNKAQDFKKDGNDAFRDGSYGEAIALYSKSIRVCGETTRAMLSNWALCALEVRNFGDVVASTLASLRVGYDEKPIFRLVKALSFLGEYDRAQQAFGLLPNGSSTKQWRDLQHGLTRCVNYRKDMIRGTTESPQEALALLVDTPSCMGNWINEAVETFLTEGKGRGLRATRDLPTGSVILVEWPLVSELTSGEFVSSMDKRTVHMGSHAQLQRMVVNRLKREAILTKIMSHMSDGKHSPDLVPVSELLVRLEVFPFLLPSHRDYYLDEHGEEVKIEEIAADRVRKILDINCHGSSDTVDGRTELYPTISMMNHESNPNCSFAGISLKLLGMVLTCQPVRKGEELTMKYQSDEIVEQKWGIKPTS